MWALRLIKFCLGLCLYPLAVVFGFALWRLLTTWEQPIDTPMRWLLGGMLAWPVLFVLLPRSVSHYVLAHEISHGLVAWCFGAEVANLTVSETEGGSIEVSKTNFLITLAPYILPLYTLLVFLGYAACALAPSLRWLQPLWLAAIGFSYSYHLVFTLWALGRDQSDIREEGHVFSYGFIAWANLALLSLALVVFAEPEVESWVRFLGEGWRWLVRSYAVVTEIWLTVVDFLNDTPHHKD